MKIEVKITAPGTLLPVVFDREIDDTQVEAITNLIEHGPYATLSTTELQVLNGALNSLDDPFSDELLTLAKVQRELNRRKVE